MPLTKRSDASICVVLWCRAALERDRDAAEKSRLKFSKQDGERPLTRSSVHCRVFLLVVRPLPCRAQSAPPVASVQTAVVALGLCAADSCAVPLLLSFGQRFLECDCWRHSDAPRARLWCPAVAESALLSRASFAAAGEGEGPSLATPRTTASSQQQRQGTTAATNDAANREGADASRNQSGTRERTRRRRDKTLTQQSSLSAADPTLDTRNLPSIFSCDLSPLFLCESRWTTGTVVAVVAAVIAMEADEDAAEVEVAAAEAAAAVEVVAVAAAVVVEAVSTSTARR